LAFNLISQPKFGSLEYIYLHINSKAQGRENKNEKGECPSPSQQPDIGLSSPHWKEGGFHCNSKFFECLKW